MMLAVADTDKYGLSSLCIEESAPHAQINNFLSVHICASKQVREC